MLGFFLSDERFNVTLPSEYMGCWGWYIREREELNWKIVYGRGSGGQVLSVVDVARSYYQDGSASYLTYSSHPVTQPIPKRTILVGHP